MAQDGVLNDSFQKLIWNCAKNAETIARFKAITEYDSEAFLASYLAGEIKIEKMESVKVRNRTMDYRNLYTKLKVFLLKNGDDVPCTAKTFKKSDGICSGIESCKTCLNNYFDKIEKEYTNYKKAYLELKESVMDRAVDMPCIGLCDDNTDCKTCYKGMFQTWECSKLDIAVNEKIIVDEKITPETYKTIKKTEPQENTSIEKIIDGELRTGNAKHGEHTSSHQSYAVILEELEEFDEEYKNLKLFILEYWQSVKNDHPKEFKLKILDSLEMLCNRALIELVQTAAMVKKAKEFESK